MLYTPSFTASKLADLQKKQYNIAFPSKRGEEEFTVSDRSLQEMQKESIENSKKKA